MPACSAANPVVWVNNATKTDTTKTQSGFGANDGIAATERLPAARTATMSRHEFFRTDIHRAAERQRGISRTFTERHLNAR